MMEGILDELYNELAKTEMEAVITRYGEDATLRQIIEKEPTDVPAQHRAAMDLGFALSQAYRDCTLDAPMSTRGEYLSESLNKLSLEDLGILHNAVREATIHMQILEKSVWASGKLKTEQSPEDQREVKIPVERFISRMAELTASVGNIFPNFKDGSGS